MDEKKAKELTDSIFDKLNDQERVYLAWVHNQKNKEIKRLNDIINELEKDLNDRYYGRGKYHMDSDIIGIKDVLNTLQELKGDKSNETNK